MIRIFKYLFAITLSVFLIKGLPVSGQSPKREMRSAWLTTAWRIDWPSVTVPAGGNSSTRLAAANQQKNELISILNSLQEANMNAVFFQVRPMADAFYRSSYEPWSQYLSSERGADPGYDPLEFAIEEAHKRGIELHAWINPYRYSSSYENHGDLPTDYSNAHPDWLIDYGKVGDKTQSKILNPGKPEVVQRITDIIEEIITNYDVDGIVFDDYFYENGVTTNEMDQAEYEAYNPDGLSRADWRRQNCDKMIASVYNKIQELKPWVTFGVSPAGVAASSAAVAEKYGVTPAPDGSDWQYNGIYSDPLAWLSQGTIDYISPQIYWTTTGSPSYAKLAPWWSGVANKFGKHFYSSHSLTSMSGAGAALSSPVSIYIRGEEIPVGELSPLERVAAEQNKDESLLRGTSASNYTFSELGLQIDWNRNGDLNGAPGSVFYATKKTVGSSFVSYLNAEKFTHTALAPAIAWKKTQEPDMVTDITLSGLNLSWTHTSDNVRYVVYAVPAGKRNEKGIFSSSEYIVGISYEKQYTLPEGISVDAYKLAVSVLDRYGNEYAPRIMGEGTEVASAPALVYPANKSEIVMPAIFRWEEAEGVDSYFWELSEDALFDNIICSRETTSPQFYSGLQTNIEDDTNYYWRVKTRKANAYSTYSDTWQFSGKKFRVNSPASGETDVSLTPRIEWDEITGADSYIVEISKSAQFLANQEVYNATVYTNSVVVPENTLTSGTGYYVRVTAVGNGFSAVSESTNFTVLSLPIPVPVIISPVDGAQLSGTQIELVWEEQNARGFRVELSQTSTFPTRSTTVKTVDAFTYSIVFTDLDEGTYYLRVKAQNDTGTTDPSAYVTVHLSAVSSVEDMIHNGRSIYNYYDRAGNTHIVVYCEENTEVSLGIYSVTGMLLNKQNHTLNKGENTLSPDMTDYPSGLYLLKIEMGREEKTLKIKK